MITAQKPRSVKTAGIQNTVSFGIKESGIAHIFNVLRNQLYTDKITAVIREYSTNAADAHVEAGCGDRPIEVTLPSRFNLQFSVRDFGPALSDKEIQDVYAFYGESTKRNTNEQTGMLGIGSKSAFAYGDNFVIISYLEGKKHTHNAFIDDTQVGQISKLSVEDTDEENGVEIIVPVRMVDVDEFEQKGKTLFRYFKTKPILNGEKLDYEEGEVLYSGDGWKFLNSNVTRYDKGQAVVVMGNIGYPIDLTQLKLADDSALSNFVCRNLVLECKIGDLEISASREGLQYTDYTIKNINAKLQEAAKEIAEKITLHFSKCKTHWEAKGLASEMFSYDGKLYSVQALCKKATWKGKPIGETSVSLRDVDEEILNVFSYNSTYRGNNKVRAESKLTVQAGGKTLIILNDKFHRRGIMPKMVHQVDEEDMTPYVFTFKKNATELEKKKTLKALGLEKSDFAKLEGLPEAQLGAHYASSSSGSAHGGAKVLLPKLQTISGYRSDPQSSYWISATVNLKTEKVLYVILDRFMYRNASGQVVDSRRFAENIQKFSEMGMLDDYDGKVYGVKMAEENRFKNNPNAIEAWDYLKTKLEEKIKQADIGTEVANIKALNNVEASWETMSKYLKHFKSDTILKQFIVEIALARAVKEKMDDDTKEKKRGKNKVYNELKDCAHCLGMELPEGTATFNPAIADTILKLYPMVSLAQDTIRYSYHSDNTESGKVKVIADYVELVNNSPRE